MRQDWRQVVMEVLNKRVQPAFILVFGSYLVEQLVRIVILILHITKRLNSYERFLLAGEIADKCNVDIDLVDIRKVDTVFAAQIFSSGEVFACDDENTFVKGRMKALSMYVTLNKQRAEILQSIEERGSVYGE
ncbi:type VII toxin-antitoxin system MntA family adenylyltransferase antitoxin [Oceanobacillus salinisoli]|uniref:type VII toxin-antitoxin system MntA family adenylyltransferase antitoxin n=1 Tax=Oceanobacillus salinisoli TaxID=2678611 RepID=UPI0018CC6B1B|nr:nucleotidyltransferase domain-containing protein [Oceanobacillus salinisoli]